MSRIYDLNGCLAREVSIEKCGDNQYKVVERDYHGNRITESDIYKLWEAMEVKKEFYETAKKEVDYEDMILR